MAIVVVKKWLKTLNEYMKMTGPPLVRGGLRGAINRILWGKSWDLVPTGKEILFKEPELQKKLFCAFPYFLCLTRPKPAYGRQGLAGSWGKDTVSIFATTLQFFCNNTSVFLQHNFCISATRSIYTEAQRNSFGAKNVMSQTWGPNLVQKTSRH